MHRWDAELATGVEHRIRSDVASFGITEVVDDLFPRQLALGRSPALSSMTAVRADDTGQDWLVGPGEAGASSSNVEASAAVLLLLFWRRVQVDDPRVHFSHDAVKGEWELARFAP